jgi:hypothetical protein
LLENENKCYTIDISIPSTQRWLLFQLIKLNFNIFGRVSAFALVPWLNMFSSSSALDLYWVLGWLPGNNFCFTYATCPGL